MHYKLKKITAMLIAILILCTADMVSYSYEMPDMTQKGSINIKMEIDGKPVSGGSITLYHIGEINFNNGSFVLKDEYKSSGLTLEDVQSEQLVKNLEQYVNNNEFNGSEKTIDKNGEVGFDNLELGLYLVIQSKAPKGYVKANSFLVSVPMSVNGKYIYSVDASPKLELETETTLPAVPDSPTKPNQSTLPKTGTLNWPVPVLIVSGLALFIIGWTMKYSRRKRKNEE